jgi:Rrf2 family transcriptional regulator, cysteine metabolism repressor
MPIFNRKVDYALLILCYLHHKNEGGSAREIAERYGISRAFVANILKDLCQSEFVRSQRGVNGGYLLLPLASERSLADLIDALDETLRLVEYNAFSFEGCCDLPDHCPVRMPIAKVQRRVRDLFEDVRLIDLFQERSIARPIQLDLSRCQAAPTKAEANEL